MPTRSKEYIGDSVYVEFDGSGLMLTTEDGFPTDPSNTIYMDQQVIQAFAHMTWVWFGEDRAKKLLWPR